MKKKSIFTSNFSARDLPGGFSGKVWAYSCDRTRIFGLTCQEMLWVTLCATERFGLHIVLVRTHSGVHDASAVSPDRVGNMAWQYGGC